MASDLATRASPQPGGLGVPLGLGYLTVAGAHPVEQIEAAAAAGFANVGLRLMAPLGLTLAHDIVADAALRREILRARARTGVAVLDADVLTLAAVTDMHAMARAVDTAAEIGASIVQVVVEDTDLRRALDRFAALCDRAAPLGLTVSLEFMKWRSLPALQQASAFVLAARRPNADLCIDCLHLSRCGNGPADVAALPAALVGYVQLCDAPRAIPPDHAIVPEARGGRMFPGEGELWLHALLDRLPQGTPLSLEVPRQQDAGRSTQQRAQLAAEAMRRFFDSRSDR